MTSHSTLLWLLLAPTFLVAQTLFYVSPSGNDSWSGTLPEANIGQSDGPFATPERARDAVRTADSFPVTVFFRDGVYFVKKPWRFEAKDSGQKNAQISYQNYGDERPIISGGIIIDQWQFEGNLWVTTLDDVKNGEIYFKELYVNDERRDRARHPNKVQFLRINGSVPENDHNAFYFYPGDVSLYQNIQDVNICLYQAWLAIHLRIDQINIGQSNIVFSPRLWFAASEFDNHTRYYIENAFELLDQPGEWYLNRRTGQLFYYPIPGETPESCTVIAACVDRVLELSGSATGGAQVEYLNFSGLRFQNADWIVTSVDKTEGQAHILLDDAVIYLKGASNCTIKRCEVALGGAHGIVLSQGCSNNVIEQCHVHALGGGGIYIGNTSGWNACEEATMAAQINTNTVQNCYIHDLTHVHHGSVGIWIGNSFDNQILHNEISDLDYTGISVGWCWGYQAATSGNNLIAFNHIHHLGQGE
ncbi:MAG: right-handed parallel beta-helix repeat-containing protein, partial [Calditrichaeota bacterium]